MQTIGGYLIVAHSTQNGWRADIVTHAFNNLRTAAKYVRARTAEINKKSEQYSEEHDSESGPTIHAVSPKLFAKVQERLSRDDAGRDSFGYNLGTAITEQSGGPNSRRPNGFPSYMVGGTEVFCTKSESEAPARPVNQDVPRGRAPSPGDE